MHAIVQLSKTVADEVHVATSCFRIRAVGAIRTRIEGVESRNSCECGAREMLVETALVMRSRRLIC